MGRPKSETKRVVIGATVLPETLIKLKEKAKENKTPVGRYAGDLLEHYMTHAEIVWISSPSLEVGQVIIDTDNEEKVITKDHTSDFPRVPIVTLKDKPKIIPSRNTDLFFYKGERTRLTILSRKLKLSIDEVKEKLRGEGYE